MPKVTSEVKIGGLYWLKQRFRCDRTGWIIKIIKLGEKLPQEIEGELLGSNSGQFSVTDGLSHFNKSNTYVFACEIGDEVSREEKEQLKNKFLDKINLFFNSQ